MIKIEYKTIKNAKKTLNLQYVMLQLENASQW